MRNEPSAQPQAGVMELITGIVSDLHALSQQRLALFRHEIQGEMGVLRDAGMIVAVGVAVLWLGSALFCVMLVYLLAHLIPVLPLWGAYGLVGCPVVATGACLCFVGVQRMKRVNIGRAKVVHALKESFDGQ